MRAAVEIEEVDLLILTRNRRRTGITQMLPEAGVKPDKFNMQD